LGPSRHVPTGKRPTEEITDCIGKMTLVPNLSCFFSAGTNTNIDAHSKIIYIDPSRIKFIRLVP